MLRTIKLTSPMSLGSWILSAFSAGIGVAAVSEIDRMTGERLPLGPLRPVLRAVEGPAGLEAALFAPPLGGLHRGAAGRHRDAHLERRARGSAVRVRQLREPGRIGSGDDHHARSPRRGPARTAGRARRDRGSGRDEGHGAPDGPGGRRAAAPRHAGTHAAVERKAGRRRRIGHAARRAPPRRRGAVGPGADGGVGTDAGSASSRPGWSRPATRATRSSRRSAAWPPAAPRASPTTRSPPGS